MTRSAVSPEPIFIRKIANNAVHLLVRWNVKETDIADEHGNRIEYEYNEQKLIVPIPDDVVSPNDLKKWIAENSSDLLNQAKSITASAAKPPKTDNIRDMSITEVRKHIADSK